MAQVGGPANPNPAPAGSSNLLRYALIAGVIAIVVLLSLIGYAVLSRRSPSQGNAGQATATNVAAAAPSAASSSVAASSARPAAGTPAIPTITTIAALQSAVSSPSATAVPTQTRAIIAQVTVTVAPTATPTKRPQPSPTSALPYALPPQPMVGHPSFYVETGVPCLAENKEFTCEDTAANTKHWVLEVLPNTVAIVGGYTVDNVDEGVYRAVAGPTKIDVTVTNGFLLVTKAEWGNAEWCFRLAEADLYKWAHKHESPLNGWSTCSAPPSQAATGAPGQRQQTGIGLTLRFNAGDRVDGVDIILDNGVTKHSCYYASAPSAGTVRTGVINPNEDETKEYEKHPCQ